MTIEWTRPEKETLRTRIGEQEYALLYGSVGKQRHIVPFKPYAYVGVNLCGHYVGILTGTGQIENLCQECLAKFEALRKNSDHGPHGI